MRWPRLGHLMLFRSDSKSLKLKWVKKRSGKLPKSLTLTTFLWWLRANTAPFVLRRVSCGVHLLPVIFRLRCRSILAIQTETKTNSQLFVRLWNGYSLSTRRWCPGCPEALCSTRQDAPAHLSCLRWSSALRRLLYTFRFFRRSSFDTDPLCKSCLRLHQERLE